MTNPLQGQALSLQAGDAEILLEGGVDVVHLDGAAAVAGEEGQSLQIGGGDADAEGLQPLGPEHRDRLPQELIPYFFLDYRGQGWGIFSLAFVFVYTVAYLMSWGLSEWNRGFSRQRIHRLVHSLTD